MNQGTRFSIAFICSAFVATASGQTTRFVDQANCLDPAGGLLPNCAVFDFDIDMDVDLDDFGSFNVTLSER